MGTASIKFEPDSYTADRQRMITQQIKSRGILDNRVILAMGTVPRHLFVPVSTRSHAYDDNPMRIGHGQTISQPYIVAYMTEQLRLTETDRVLEIGTGCGYQTAVLAAIAAEVYTIERIEELSEIARKNLALNGFSQRIQFRIGDGSLGWPENAPYQAILVTAASPKAPETLKQQLADGGRLVIPVGERYQQNILSITRHGDLFEEEVQIGCIFVPLIGQLGW